MVLLVKFYTLILLDVSPVSMTWRPGTSHSPATELPPEDAGQS